MTVAVLDSGVDSSVPELNGQVLKGVDMSVRPLDANQDQDGHGTGMAALIAGKAVGEGIHGLAPGVKILPVRTAPDTTDRLWGKAIRYAVDNGARVINISMAGPGNLENSPLTEAAVKYALSKGSLIFAGSGNDGEDGNLTNFPAAIPGVVSVGAIDQSGTVTKWSNSASNVALAAPGDEIPGRCRKSEGFCATTGTSAATAIVSASAALIWAKHPGWTNNQVLRVMMDTAGKPTTGKVPSIYIGYGIVRPRKVLVDGEGDPGPADVNPLLAAAGASTSKQPSPQPSQEKKSDSKAHAPAPEKTENASGSSGNTGLWIGIGAGAAVVVAGAATAALVRQRKRAAAQAMYADPYSPTAPPPPPYGPGCGQ
ncbi:S8 family serine peptidase [Streptomyces albireticuli]|uniref:S8 family serine peptidase n=1 Tax=Streptomyces albireticuli TaxID=1940 RepID=UPI001E39B65D|nr:S8 family serine peptidase [Streptomyces albireticuli]MCD9143997.1 S8 family serine peptidase [Streptomyces albireticuli]MCD9162360.1 S8 family serine peptidase [Streptomyces albireticuli]MCD9195471.1 S8 family serine peptidase [Streptomyces albireticuli]